MRRTKPPPKHREMKLSPKQREALRLVAEGKFFPDFVREDDGWHARWRAVSGDNAWVDEFVREAVVTPLCEDAELQRHETLHDAWMAALQSRTGAVAWNEAECEAFAAELREWNGAAEEDSEARGAIVFSFAPFRVTCAVPRGRRGLKALGQAACVWGPLRGMKSEPGGMLGVSLTKAEAEDFILHGARDLADAGYRVEGIDIAAAVTAEADIDDGGSAPALGGSAPRPVSLKLTVKVAGEAVSAEEIRFLLDQGSSLVFFRDRWIEVDRGILKEALRALERGERHNVSPLGFAMGVGRIGRLEIDTLRAHGWIRGLVNELRAAGRTQELSPGGVLAGFAGTLRDYQERGLEWLRFMTSHGFGALLADDMGLGKTVQTIAWLVGEKESGRSSGRPTLIVAPLTLLSNWAHELARFAPSLKVVVHHGTLRGAGMGFSRSISDADAVLTNYGTLVRDYRDISEVEWHAMVLDEAQAIKNPDTQTARAAVALSPPNRIALTGTPVENSVTDVWSVEEFLNPGFLGDRKSFVERFARPIAADGQCAAAARLRRALEPFVLRRLKTDPRIAAELGERREIREYCELCPEQRREYEAELADFRARERTRGDVFALISALKLVCDGEGKRQRLYELVGQILEAGESVLVFTQYAKVGAVLCAELEARFGRKVPFLHGGLGTKERDAQIAQFNRGGASAFVLSLRAGGFGLNLVKATHVVHFDRWWNPAVENQATDRAHRIGQKHTVFVHLLISAGTLEEHVDELLRGKSRIAGSVITEAEWLEAAKLDGQGS